MTISNSRVLVIGGAGFVGSHIVDQLLREPLREIVVLDNFVRGVPTNLRQAMQDSRVRVIEGSITDGELLRELIAAGIDAREFSAGDPVFVERMIAAMVLDYVVMVNEDPSIDHDAELLDRILKFLQ